MVIKLVWVKLACHSYPVHHLRKKIFLTVCGYGLLFGFSLSYPPPFPYNLHQPIERAVQWGGNPNPNLNPNPNPSLGGITPSESAVGPYPVPSNHRSSARSPSSMDETIATSW